uniref:Fucolectin tachylectin-4 pentraxin-1 domain-containing protein n=1 Tax=Cyprinus carpio TaxID=7962 RepID=A0A8C2BVS5_CYPCA
RFYSILVSLLASTLSIVIICRSCQKVVGKNVTQSSTYELWSAEQATDFNPGFIQPSSSCSSTDIQTNPWWRVDLSSVERVIRVIITNRLDCCPERINGAEIRIGNSLENNGNNNPICAVISSIPAGVSSTYTCNNMEGRYVNLFLPGDSKYLTLCEVEVYGEAGTPAPAHYGPTFSIKNIPVNIATWGTPVQSTLAYNWYAQNALDGLRSTCTHTAVQSDPWWKLDLMKTYSVNRVTITNRPDCCSDRINGAEIRIGNNSLDVSSNPVCAAVPSIPAGATYSYSCRGMEGRYVIVNIPGASKILTLCEVGVYVIFPGNSEDVRNPHSLMEGKEMLCPHATTLNHSTVTQSSTFGTWVGEQAIDFNPGFIQPSSSCSSTTAQTNPWWRVDLHYIYRVSSVVITNRLDCCPERINGAEIRIGNSLENNGNNNPICAVISSIPAGVSSTYICNDMNGRYVNLFIPGDSRFLTLCEVEVYGEGCTHTAVTLRTRNTHPEQWAAIYAAAPREQLGVRCLAQGHLSRNLATGRTVTQSSTFDTWVGEQAIDLNPSFIQPSSSCSSTDIQTNPWWRVDLHYIYRVSSVVITNRLDCCPERINGAEIRIGNSLENNGNNNPICAVISSIPAGVSSTYICNDMDGRYVNLFLPGDSRFLTLCEVEVYGEGKKNNNIATSIGHAHFCDTLNAFYLYLYFN